MIRPTQGLDRSHARPVWAEVNRVLRARSPSRLVLDLRNVARIDGAGVALVRELEERCRRRGIEFRAEGATQAVSAFLDFVRDRSPGEEAGVAPAQRPAGLLRHLGDHAASAGRTRRAFFELVGEYAESAAYLATHPHRIRVGDLLFQVQRVGANGMWLIGWLSVLLGIIMAFQGLGGARSWSPVLIADVVTMSTTREMAPLLTAIIVTGRSGAAIAAEIGTMKIDQELDALTVMGFDVMRFLLFPRTLALAIATPLLTLLSVGAGILGGVTVAVSVLHLSPVQYFAEVEKVISAAQVASALAKGLTFGILIGVVACFEGLQAGKAAQDVGKQTTAAVVRSLLLIIFADAFFSVAAEVYGW